MKKFIFMFDGPIYYNKAPCPPGTPLVKIILLHFYESYGDIDIYVESP